MHDHTHADGEKCPMHEEQALEAQQAQTSTAAADTGEQLAALQAQVAELQDQYIRGQAEVANARRRAEEVLELERAVLEPRLGDRRDDALLHLNDFDRDPNNIFPDATVFLELVDEVDYAIMAGTVAPFDAMGRDSDGQVCFSGASAADEDQVPGLAEEIAIIQVADQHLVDG